MASVSLRKGTKDEVAATPLVDGQLLIETDQGDLNKIYTDTLDTSVTPNVVKRTYAGGGGHLILPNPKADPPTVPTPTEDLVVDAVNNASATTEIINSLYGTQQWTNEKTKRYILSGSGGKIGSSGVGTFPEEDAEVIQVTPVGSENPSEEGWYEIINHQYELTADTTVDSSKKYFSQIIDESDWLYLDIFTTIENTNPVSGMGADNIDLKLKFDPSTNEPIVLGGYVIDTDTGNICIKFGNSISDTENAKIAIDITYTRNEVSYIS